MESETTYRRPDACFNEAAIGTAAPWAALPSSAAASLDGGPFSWSYSPPVYSPALSQVLQCDLPTLHRTLALQTEASSPLASPHSTSTLKSPQYIVTSPSNSVVFPVSTGLSPVQDGDHPTVENSRLDRIVHHSLPEGTLSSPQVLCPIPVHPCVHSKKIYF